MEDKIIKNFFIFLIFGFLISSHHTDLRGLGKIEVVRLLFKTQVFNFLVALPEAIGFMVWLSVLLFLKEIYDKWKKRNIS